MLDALYVRPLQAPDLNIGLLSKVMDHIEHHPEEHDQTYWATKTTTTACGTAFCFAGHAVNMTLGPNERMVWEGIFTSSDDNRMVIGSSWVGPSKEGDDARVLKDYSSLVPISTRAVDELGLMRIEAYDLFRATNTRQDLRLMVDNLVRAEQARLARLTQRVRHD